MDYLSKHCISNELNFEVSILAKLYFILLSYRKIASRIPGTHWEFLKEI